MAKLVAYERDGYTPNEPWTTEAPANHHYTAAAEFAVKSLGNACGQCLVVGSPPFEATALASVGWTVTLVDVRQPPYGGRVVVADASRLPFPDNHFDAVSSTCVLCHVGLGRYGDRLTENGDVVALREMARVTRPGGRLAIMVGPTVPRLSRRLILGSTHRLYRTSDAAYLASLAQLTLGKARVWQDGWLDEAAFGRCIERDKREPWKIPVYYLAALFTKPREPKMPNSPLVLLDAVSEPEVGPVFNLGDKTLLPVELRLEPSPDATGNSSGFANPAIVIEWSLDETFTDTFQGKATVMSVPITFGGPTDPKAVSLSVMPLSVQGLSNPNPQFALPFIRATMLGTLVTGSITLKLFFTIQ